MPVEIDFLSHYRSLLYHLPKEWENLTLQNH